MTLRKCKVTQLDDARAGQDPKPETAEDRVRRAASVDLSDVQRDDLRTILAELDRLRVAFADAERRIDLRDADIERHEIARQQDADELNQLRAQKAVDVEKVLGPIRHLEKTLERDLADRAGRVLDRVRGFEFSQATFADGERSAFDIALYDVRMAIAEAEKIAKGRG